MTDILNKIAVSGLLALVGLCQPAYADVVLDSAEKLSAFGDFRLRGEYDERTKNDGTEQSRNRLRYRARLGMAFRVNDRWSARMRLATNISSINSPHVTFGGDPDIGFDQAYLKYRGDSIKIMAGKQPLNYWNSSEMVWDKDFNPDALGFVYNRQNFTLNAAHIILQESNWDNRDQRIDMLQGVYHSHSIILALGYFNNNDGGAAETVGTFSAQYMAADWRSVIELSVSDAAIENQAWSLQFRKNLARGMGLRIYYMYVEAQSVPGDGKYGQDDFPDQNGSGLSNFQGLRLQYDQQLDKNLAMDVRLYNMRAINEDFAAAAAPGNPYFADDNRTRLQININLKF